VVAVQNSWARCAMRDESDETRRGSARFGDAKSWADARHACLGTQARPIAELNRSEPRPILERSRSCMGATVPQYIFLSPGMFGFTRPPVYPCARLGADVAPGTTF